MGSMQKLAASFRLHLTTAQSQLASGLGMAAALGIAYLGQRTLDRGGASLWGWAPLIGGAALFALLARRQATAGPATVGGIATEAPHLTPLTLAFGLAALAFLGFGGNRFRLLPTLAWVAALAFLYAAFRRGAAASPSAQASDSDRPVLSARGLHLSWHALALMAILGVAAVLRMRLLDTIPREMGVDMPLIYENAREIIEGQFMIFCPRFPGRESLYHYLLAAYGAVFGLSFFSIKFVCALCGVATVAALYGLARYLFDRDVGLVAAAFLALSKWHVLLSRTGYRAVLMPLAVILVIWATARALRRGGAAGFVPAGMALGLGMYTYNAFLIVPPMLVACLAVELALRGKGSLRRYGWGLVALALGAVMVFLPLGRYALEEPDKYLYRVATRVSGIEAPLPEDIVRVFSGNLVRAAAMFNLQGDHVYTINVPYQRQLGAISGTLFVAGLLYALIRWRHGHNAMVLIMLVGLILPTALAVVFPKEVPNAVRASGALSPAYLLAALPPVLLCRRLGGVWQGAGPQRFLALVASPPWLRLRWRGSLPLNGGLLLVACMAVLLGAELQETWRACFEDYVLHLPGRNYAISLELARALDEFSPEGPAYIKVWPHWYDGNAVRAQLEVVDAPQAEWELYELDPAKPPLSTAQGRVLFLLHPDDQDALALLRTCFPQSVAVNHWGYEGRVAYVAFYGER